MNRKENVCDKFAELISLSENLKIGNAAGQRRNSAHEHGCIAWLASAQNLVHFVLGDSSSPYKDRTDSICSESHGYMIHEAVGSVAAMLRALSTDIDNGLISSIENQTRGVVFSDFLDHARAYAERNQPSESGAISGVVFEDTIRTLCRMHNVEENGVQLDLLISQLSKKGVLSQIKAKRARAAANVRTKATHAQWDEFDRSDVMATIEFTQELISKNFD